MYLTHQAQERIIQRHISEDQLDCLLSYGRVGHNKGACVYFFDRDGFAQLINEVEPRLAQRSRDIYAVVVNDTVITAGLRDERLKPQKPHRRIRRHTPINPAARRIRHVAR